MFHYGLQAFHELFAELVDYCQVEFLLAAEVLIEDRLGNSTGAGKFSGAGCKVSFRAKTFFACARMRVLRSSPRILECCSCRPCPIPSKIQSLLVSVN